MLAVQMYSSGSGSDSFDSEEFCGTVAEQMRHIDDEPLPNDLTDVVSDVPGVLLPHIEPHRRAKRQTKTDPTVAAFTSGSLLLDTILQHVIRQLESSLEIWLDPSDPLLLRTMRALETVLIKIVHPEATARAVKYYRTKPDALIDAVQPVMNSFAPQLTEMIRCTTRLAALIAETYSYFPERVSGPEPSPPPTLSAYIQRTENLSPLAVGSALHTQLMATTLKANHALVAMMARPSMEKSSTISLQTRHIGEFLAVGNKLATQLGEILSCISRAHTLFEGKLTHAQILDIMPETACCGVQFNLRQFDNDPPFQDIADGPNFVKAAWEKMTLLISANEAPTATYVSPDLRDPTQFPDEKPGKSGPSFQPLKSKTVALALPKPARKEYERRKPRKFKDKTLNEVNLQLGFAKPRKRAPNGERRRKRAGQEDTPAAKRRKVDTGDEDGAIAIQEDEATDDNPAVDVEAEMKMEQAIIDANMAQLASKEARVQKLLAQAEASRQRKEQLAIKLGLANTINRIRARELEVELATENRIWESATASYTHEHQSLILLQEAIAAGNMRQVNLNSPTDTLVLDRSRFVRLAAAQSLTHTTLPIPTENGDPNDANMARMQATGAGSADTFTFGSSIARSLKRCQRFLNCRATATLAQHARHRFIGSLLSTLHGITDLVGQLKPFMIPCCPTGMSAKLLRDDKSMRLRIHKATTSAYCAPGAKPNPISKRQQDAFIIHTEQQVSCMRVLDVGSLSTTLAIMAGAPHHPQDEMSVAARAARVYEGACIRVSEAMQKYTLAFQTAVLEGFQRLMVSTRNDQGIDSAVTDVVAARFRELIQRLDTLYQNPQNDVPTEAVIIGDAPASVFDPERHEQYMDVLADLSFLLRIVKPGGFAEQKRPLICSEFARIDDDGRQFYAYDQSLIPGHAMANLVGVFADINKAGLVSGTVSKGNACQSAAQYCYTTCSKTTAIRRRRNEADGAANPPPGSVTALLNEGAWSQIWAWMAKEEKVAQAKKDAREHIRDEERRRFFRLENAPSAVAIKPPTKKVQDDKRREERRLQLELGVLKQGARDNGGGGGRAKQEAIENHLVEDGMSFTITNGDDYGIPLDELSTAVNRNNTRATKTRAGSLKHIARLVEAELKTLIACANDFICAIIDDPEFLGADTTATILEHCRSFMPGGEEAVRETSPPALTLPTPTQDTGKSSLLVSDCAGQLQQRHAPSQLLEPILVAPEPVHIKPDEGARELFGNTYVDETQEEHALARLLAAPACELSSPSKPFSVKHESMALCLSDEDGFPAFSTVTMNEPCIPEAFFDTFERDFSPGETVFFR